MVRLIVSDCRWIIRTMKITKSRAKWYASTRERQSTRPVSVAVHQRISWHHRRRNVTIGHVSTSPKSWCLPPGTPTDASVSGMSTPVIILFCCPNGVYALMPRHSMSSRCKFIFLKQIGNWIPIVIWYDASESICQRCYRRYLLKSGSDEWRECTVLSSILSDP